MGTLRTVSDLDKGIIFIGVRDIVDIDESVGTSGQQDLVGRWVKIHLEVKLDEDMVSLLFRFGSCTSVTSSLWLSTYCCVGLDEFLLSLICHQICQCGDCRLLSNY